MPARLAVLAASAVTLLVPSAGVGADNPQLEASVGANDGFSITLQDATGNRVTHLDAGTYTIKVHDLSTIHNFHLTGPGVDMTTPVDTDAEATWTVTLQDGTYKYVCDAHPTVMRGSFTVGAVTTPPPATKLTGSVGPGRTISLRFAGGGRVTVLAGTDNVAVTVNDRSRTDNFHLIGKGVNKATGVRFRGRVVWNLGLVPGKYVYRSDKHRALRRSFIVSSSDYPARS